MKLLEELDKVCSPKWVEKFINSRQSTSASDSLVWKLYQLLHSDKYEEHEIVKKLYGKDKTPSYGPFRTLRTRLRHILVNAFVLQQLAEPTYRTYDEAYQNGFRQLEVARMLAGKRAYNAAREIASRTFGKVKDYEIVPLNLGLADLLSSMYLGVHYNEELFNHYLNLANYYNKAAYDLGIVTSFYRKLRNSIYAQRESPAEMGEMARRYVQDCEDIRGRYPEISIIQVMIIITEMNGCVLRGDYHKAIDVSLQGMETLSRCKGSSLATLSLLALERVNCTIKLRDFKLGKQQIREARKHIAPNTINDIKLTDYAILLGFRTSNYNFAYQEFANVNRRKLRQLLTSRSLEYWRILEAYVNFLIVAGEIQPQDDWPPLPSFRISRFINNVPTSTRNKKGTNIQILIVQVLYFMVTDKHSRAIDRTEALESYCNRYLREDKNLRNNCFFKLLLVAIQNGFKRIPTERKSEKIYNKMVQADNMTSNLNDTELIKYEDLWAIVLKHLD